MVMKEILEMTVGCLFLMFTMVSTIQMMKKPSVCVHTHYTYVLTLMITHESYTHRWCTWLYACLVLFVIQMHSYIHTGIIPVVLR